MNKRLKRIAIVLGGLFVVVVSLIRIGQYRMNHSNSDQALTQTLGGSINHYVGTYQGSPYTLRTLHIPHSGKLPLVLIHGTPGSISDWSALVSDTSITEDYDLYLVDRPGFGGSMHDQSFPTIDQQATMIGQWIRDEVPASAIVVGYSFGGEVVPAIARDYSERLSGMVIVSGMTDPDHQTVWLASYMMDRPLIRWMIPPFLQHVNDEKLASRHELRQFADEGGRDSITIPTTILHGADDRIVDPLNADFVDRALISAPHRILLFSGHGHEIPYSSPDLILQGLDALHSLQSY